MVELANVFTIAYFTFVTPITKRQSETKIFYKFCETAKDSRSKHKVILKLVKCTI